MRKRCIRKVYQPVNPIALAMSGAAITPAAILDKLRMKELSSIESFRTGTASREDWKACADMLNLCETMAKEGIGREAKAACETAQAALERAHDRHQATGKYGVDGPGLQALRDLYEWHDAQRQAIPRSQYERLITLTAERLRTAIRAARNDGTVRALG